jgi:hypothetical protein
LNTNAIRENNDEAMRRNLKEFEELTQNFNKGGREEEEAKKQSIVSYLPKLQKDLHTECLSGSSAVSGSGNRKKIQYTRRSWRREMRL